MTFDTAAITSVALTFAYLSFIAGYIAGWVDRRIASAVYRRVVKVYRALRSRVALGRSMNAPK